MEIKTTRQIFDDNSDTFLIKGDVKKQWVAVEDMKKIRDKIVQEINHHIYHKKSCRDHRECFEIIRNKVDGLFQHLSSPSQSECDTCKGTKVVQVSRVYRPCPDCSVGTGTGNQRFPELPSETNKEVNHGKRFSKLLKDNDF